MTATALTVQINLPGIRDKKFVEDSKREVEETLLRINSLSAEINGYVKIQLHRALGA